MLIVLRNFGRFSTCFQHFWSFFLIFNILSGLLIVFKDFWAVFRGVFNIFDDVSIFLTVFLQFFKIIDCFFKIFRFIWIFFYSLSWFLTVFYRLLIFLRIYYNFSTFLAIFEHFLRFVDTITFKSVGTHQDFH